MFNCFGPKYKHKHVLIMGLEDSGKTSLMYRIKFDGFSDIIYTEPTVGFNREYLTFNESKLRVTMTDLPGVEELRGPVWGQFISENVDGIIYVVDAFLAITQPEYLLDAKDIFWKTLDENHQLDTCPVIIFLNKMDKAKRVIKYDMEDGFNISQWLAEEFELEQLQWRSYLVQPCSTKRNNPKVMHGMRWLNSKMASKTMGKDKSFGSKKHGVNLSRRDSTHVVTRRHKKYKKRQIEPPVIIEREYNPMPAAESVIYNPHQGLDDRLSQMHISNTHSRLNYQSDRRTRLGHDFISESDITEFVIKKKKHGGPVKRNRRMNSDKMPSAAKCPLGFGSIKPPKCHQYDMSCNKHYTNIDDPQMAMLEEEFLHPQKGPGPHCHEYDMLCS